jgi:hypothetical protein
LSAFSELNEAVVHPGPARLRRDAAAPARPCDVERDERLAGLDFARVVAKGIESTPADVAAVRFVLGSEKAKLLWLEHGLAERAFELRAGMNRLR